MNNNDPYRRQVHGCSVVLAVLVPIGLLGMLGYLVRVHSVTHQSGLGLEALVITGVAATGAAAGAGWSWLASRQTDRLWFSAGLGAAVTLPFLAVYAFLCALHGGLANVHLVW
ncbi:hypothetical protein AB0F92_40945 [Kitasatospora aureofaciens]|nr:hypothetical protein CP971_33895 [Streptomyces viridifaciens]UKZ03765.1 hypothetical protein BOQ63_006715 [Streptomyces viridifaciens]